MAIFSTPLGQFRNKLGNTVTYSYDGTTIMRSAATKVRNPRTPKQLQQRARFSAAINMTRRMAALLAMSYTRKTKMESTANSFMRINMPAISVDGTLQTTVDYKTLQVAYGKLVDYPVKVSWDNELGEYTFAQGAEQMLAKTYPADTENMMIAVLLNAISGNVHVVELKKIGEVDSTQLALPEGWSKEETKVYTFAVNKELKLSSDSCYHEV